MVIRIVSRPTRYLLIKMISFALFSMKHYRLDSMHVRRTMQLHNCKTSYVQLVAKLQCVNLVTAKLIRY